MKTIKEKKSSKKAPKISKKIKSEPITCPTCQTILFLMVKNVDKSIDLYRCSCCGTKYEICIKNNKKTISKKIIEENNGFKLYSKDNK
jgi:transcription elongation factor Elf1